MRVSSPWMRLRLRHSEVSLRHQPGLISGLKVFRTGLNVLQARAGVAVALKILPEHVFAYLGDPRSSSVMISNSERSSGGWLLIAIQRDELRSR